MGGVGSDSIFYVSSSVVLAVMIKIHVYSEPSGLSDSELTICREELELSANHRALLTVSISPLDSADDSLLVASVD